MLSTKLYTKYSDRDKIIRVFITGNYELLCCLFGITRATGKLCMCVTTEKIFKYECTLTGRHCCLWCHIRQDQLKSELTPGLLASSNLHTLDTIINDHNRFVANGGDHKRAKDYHNALCEPFFDIPLNQVTIATSVTRIVEPTHCPMGFHAWLACFTGCFLSPV